MGGAQRQHRLTGRSAAVTALVTLVALVASGCGSDDGPTLTDDAGGTTVVLEPQQVPEDGDLDYAAGVIDDRLGAAGFPDATVEASDDTLVVSSEPVIDPALLQNIARRGDLSFRAVGLVMPGSLHEDQTCEDLDLYPDNDPDRGCYELGAEVMDGSGVTKAGAREELGEWVVDVAFSGTEFVDRVAKPYVNKQVAVVVDDVVQSAPTINPGITASRVQINGEYGEGDATALAATLEVAELLPFAFDVRDVDGTSPTTTSSTTVP